MRSGMRCVWSSPFAGFSPHLKVNGKQEYAFYGMDMMEFSKALSAELYHLDVRYIGYCNETALVIWSKNEWCWIYPKLRSHVLS